MTGWSTIRLPEEDGTDGTCPIDEARPRRALREFAAHRRAERNSLGLGNARINCGELRDTGRAESDECPGGLPNSYRRAAHRSRRRRP